MTLGYGRFGPPLKTDDGGEKYWPLDDILSVHKYMSGNRLFDIGLDKALEMRDCIKCIEHPNIWGAEYID